MNYIPGAVSGTTISCLPGSARKHGLTERFMAASQALRAWTSEFSAVCLTEKYTANAVQLPV